MPKYPEINKKLNTLREYLMELKPYITLDTNDIIGNNEKVRTMERMFQLVVDEAIDINSFIAFQIANTVPESYRSSFVVLVETKMLDQELVDTLSDSARLRNQIVHDYEKIQKRDSIEAIKNFYPKYEKYLSILIEKMS